MFTQWYDLVDNKHKGFLRLITGRILINIDLTLKLIKAFLLSALIVISIIRTLFLLAFLSLVKFLPFKPLLARVIGWKDQILSKQD